MTAPFVLPLTVLFQHCDPAGIVFYPRYFELMNQTVETWFDVAIGFPFAAMHMTHGVGVPAVSVSAEFRAPSRLGDRLDMALSVTGIGRTSADLRLVASCGGETRLEGRCVIVQMTLATGRPASWTDPVRAEMQRFLAAPGQPDAPAR